MRVNLPPISFLTYTLEFELIVQPLDSAPFIDVDNLLSNSQNGGDIAFGFAGQDQEQSLTLALGQTMIDVPDQFAFVGSVVLEVGATIIIVIVGRHFLAELLEDLLVDRYLGKLVFTLGHEIGLARNAVW